MPVGHATMASLATKFLVTGIWTCLLTISSGLSASAADDERSAIEASTLRELPAPTVSFVVKVVDTDCQRAGEPTQLTYNSIEDAVEDTIPGEWWPPNGYGYTMYNGALKSAAIIVRTRVTYQTNYYLYPTAAYATANVDWPASQQLPANCGEWQMNTILPKPVNNSEGGSHWGNQSGYQSNLATEQTATRVVINSASQVIFSEWNMSVETRVVECNYFSRDWGYCAKNALIELPGYANYTTRRLSDELTNRFSFQAEARNTLVSQNPTCGFNYWFWSNYSPDGDGSDGSTWHGSHFMKAMPNNGCGFSSNQGYETKSASMTYKAPFPQSGTWYVWIRGMGGSINDDSVHVSLDGPGGNALDITGWDANVWRWSNTRQGGARSTVTMSGDPFHTLYVWMREDGMRVDEVLLTTDPNYTPSG